MTAINLRNIKGLDIDIEELDENMTCVELSLGTVRVKYCSNKSKDECLEAAFQMFVNSLIEQRTVTCIKCERVFKDHEAYNKFIGQSTII